MRGFRFMRRSLIAAVCGSSLILICAVLATRKQGSPGNCPFSVQYVGSTNSPIPQLGRCAVFLITNRGDIDLQYRSFAENKMDGKFSTFPSALHKEGPWSMGSFGDLRAREGHPYYVPLVSRSEPFRITVACRSASTKLERLRWACSEWFRGRRLEGVGRLISKGTDVHMHFSSEVKQAPLEQQPTQAGR
jgi:hypothetical protein